MLNVKFDEQGYRQDSMYKLMSDVLEHMQVKKSEWEFEYNDSTGWLCTGIVLSRFLTNKKIRSLKKIDEIPIPCCPWVRYKGLSAFQDLIANIKPSQTRFKSHVYTTNEWVIECPIGYVDMPKSILLDLD